MASLFAGQPLQAPSYAATTTDVPKWLQDYTVDLFSQQRAVAGTPYQPYQLPRIADVTAPTTAAQNLITRSSGAYQPAMQNAIAGTQGLTGQQAGVTSGLGMLQQAAGMSGIGAAQPLFNQATSLTGQAGAANTAAALEAGQAQYTNPALMTQNLNQGQASLARAGQQDVMGAASPYLQAAGQSAASTVGSYMNPYTQSVTDQIAKLGARNLSENLLPGVSDQFIRAGQFGSSGMGTFGQRALRDTQEAILNQQSQALQAGYNQALSAAQTDLSRQGQLATTAGQLTGQQAQNLANLGQTYTQAGQAQQTTGLTAEQAAAQARQADVQRQLTAAGQLGTIGQQTGALTQAGQQNLGTIGAQMAATSQAEAIRQAQTQQQVADLAKMQQGLTTADAAALEAVGSAQQAQAQRGLDVAFQDYQNQINFPQQQINNMSATLRGLPATAVPTTGTTTGSTTQFTPSPLSQIASAFATYKGLTAAKGGLIDGYATGGAVSADDLHSSVMADYGQYFNKGGMVPGYAEEGYVDVENPADLVDGGQAFADQYAAMQQQYPTQQDMPVAAMPRMSYTQDPEVARANAERKALLKQLQESLTKAPASTDYGPSESEKWLNLAAAFSDPGKTGSFGEGMGRAASSLAAYKADQRKARALNAAADLQRLQSRSALAQQQYEMERDEGKRRMIEQYLMPKPPSTEGATVGGTAGATTGPTGIPDNMKALLLSLDADEAVKTLVDMAKEQNKPSDLIRGINFLVGNNAITKEQGNAIVQENLQGKLEMVDVAIPELGGTFKLTGPEARRFYESNVLPARFAQTAAPAGAPAQAAAPTGASAQAAPAAPKQLPLSQEQMKAKETGLVEQSKADIAASGDLLAQKSFAKQQKDAANLILGYAKNSPKSFGVLADPTFSNALANLVDTGVNTPWGSVGLAVEEPIAKLKLTGPEASVRQLAAAPIALIEVGYRKLFLKGEGAVSNMEGALTKYIGPQLSDSAKTVQLKAGMITIGAEKQEKIVDAFEKYKEQHPEAGPRSFYQTPEYKRINDNYEMKYRNFAEKNGIPVAASTATSGGSLAERIRQERANRQNKEGK